MAGKALEEVELHRLIDAYLDRTNDTVIITNGELRADTPGPVIRWINAAALRSGGYSAEDLIGQPLAALYPRDSFPRILEQLQETAQGKVPMQHETQALDRNGRAVWLQVNTVPIFDAAGRLSHLIRIGRDITVRKRIEQERETTQRLLASVFGVIDQALGVVDASGNFAMVNTAVTRQLGWSVFDLVGKPFTTVIEEASRKWLTRQLAAREEVEQTCRLPTELVHRNGTIIAGEIVSAVIMQPDGRQYRAITFLQKAAAAAAPPAPDISVQSAIRDLLKREGSPAAIVAGKVQLVGMTEIREALGERWQDVSAGVFTLAEHILRRHIGPNDACHRTADDGFLVCFAELDEAEAQVKAQTIADEIRATLASVAPEMAGANVTGFAARVSIDSTESGSDEAIIHALEGRLAREKRRLEGGAIEALRGGLANAQAVFQKVRTETNQVAPFTMVRLPKALESALDTLRHSAGRITGSKPSCWC